LLLAVQAYEEMEFQSQSSATDLFEHHRSRLFGLAYRMLESRAEAEDVVQDASPGTRRIVSVYATLNPAGLEWTETVTRVGVTHVPDAVYDRVREHFSEGEMVALTFAVISINAWTRIAIPFRAPAGTYQPASTSVA
jgi:alkylhydroperoxidase family enzyme